jgi:hypothetical protein
MAKQARWRRPGRRSALSAIAGVLALAAAGTLRLLPALPAPLLRPA